MGSYSIEWKRSATREFRKLSAEARRRVLSAIERLAEDPYPAGARKLVGADALRLRVGDYRVIYSVLSTGLVIEIVRVGHRQGVYRQPL